MRRRTKEEQDSRHERLRHAQKTGDWLTHPGGGGVPMVIEDGVIRIAKRFRTKVQTARKEIENGYKADPKQEA